MHNPSHYSLSAHEIRGYGLTAAFALAWLRVQASPGTVARLSPEDMQTLLNLLPDVGLADLQTLELIEMTADDNVTCIELRCDQSQPGREAIRELRQHGLSNEAIGAAHRAFTRDVHLQPNSVMAEYYRSLRINVLGTERAFVRFALQFEALYSKQSKQVIDKGGWQPQVKTLQLLAGEGIPKTFIDEKRLEFGEASPTLQGTSRLSRDHQFMAFCRNAWTQVGHNRRELEQQLSAAR